MKNTIIIISFILSITATFVITKQIYDVDLPPTPSPENEIIHNTVNIPPINIPATIKKENINIIIQDIPDFILQDAVISQLDSTYIAEADSTILFTNKIYETDSTYIEVTDTLKVKVQYFYPPYNLFKLSPQLSYSSLKRTEYKPVYIERQETFLDKFAIVIGAGYSTHLDKIEVKPSFFIGLAYRIKLSF